MNCMKTGMRIRFVSIVCVLPGIVLLVTGAGVRLFVENLDAVKEGSEMVEEQICMRISSRAVGAMKRKELSFTCYYANKVSASLSCLWLLVLL